MKTILILLLIVISFSAHSLFGQNSFNFHNKDFRLKKDKITSSVYFGGGISNAIGISGTGYSFTGGTDLNLGNPLFFNLSLDIFRDPRDEENVVRLFTNVNIQLLFKHRFDDKLDLYGCGGFFLFFNGTGIPIVLLASAGIDYKIGEQVQIGYSIKHPNYLGKGFDRNPVLLNSIVLKLDF